MLWNRDYLELGKLIRYCDDFVVICRTRPDAEKALTIIKQIIKVLKLTLHPTKSRLVYMEQEGFDFLGFHFHKVITKRTGKLAPICWPSQKAMKSVRSKIKEITGRQNMRISQEEQIAKLNPLIRGWRNYFKAGNSTKKFQDLDRYVRVRLTKSAKDRKGSREKLDKDIYRIWYSKSGIENFYLPGTCTA